MEKGGKGQEEGGREGSRKFTTPFGCVRRRDVTSSPRRYCCWCQTPASRSPVSHTIFVLVLCGGGMAPSRKPTDSDGGDDAADGA
jgi:hypothetical protein